MPPATEKLVVEHLRAVISTRLDRMDGRVLPIEKRLELVQA